jgi:hypothetical protein
MIQRFEEHRREYEPNASLTIACDEYRELYCEIVRAT